MLDVVFVVCDVVVGILVCVFSDLWIYSLRVCWLCFPSGWVILRFKCGLTCELVGVWRSWGSLSGLMLFGWLAVWCGVL